MWQLFIFFLMLFADGANVYTPPQSVAVVEGENLELFCIFDTKVNCVWEKNQKQVELEGVERYRYLIGNGKGTPNCSIVINSTKEYDSGVWECKTTADDSGNNIVKTVPIYLHVQALQITMQPNDITKVQRGQNVILPCKYNAKVNCSWMRNGQSMTSFVYVDNKINGISTNDCSIEIRNVSRRFYGGNWTCKSKVTSITTKSVQSDNTEIQIKDPQIINGPDHVNIAYNEPATLNCIFDDPVDCVWKLNNSNVNVDGYKIIFKQDNGLNTRICSIIIKQIGYNDSGEWRCSDRLNESISSVEATLAIVVMESNRYSTSSVVMYVVIAIETLILIFIAGRFIYKKFLKSSSNASPKDRNAKPDEIAKMVVKTKTNIEDPVTSNDR